jgi:hypothetical protein
MGYGSLAVVAEWLAAVNRGDAERAGQLSADELEIAGPRGSVRGRQALAAWMGRAGFSAQALRWFCGAGGNVVVEQAAHWVDRLTGAERGSARVASQFVADGAYVASYTRHDDLHRALSAAGLGYDDEVAHDLRGP